MSGHFMDYGDDWPPPPAPPKPARRTWPLWQKLGAWGLLYVLVAILALVGLHVRQQHVPPFDPYRTPSAATTTTAPHPATASGHPGPADRRPTHRGDQR